MDPMIHLRRPFPLVGVEREMRIRSIVSIGRKLRSSIYSSDRLCWLNKCSGFALPGLTYEYYVTAYDAASAQETSPSNTISLMIEAQEVDPQQPDPGTDPGTGTDPGVPGTDNPDNGGVDNGNPNGNNGNGNGNGSENGNNGNNGNGMATMVVPALVMSNQMVAVRRQAKEPQIRAVMVRVIVE